MQENKKVKCLINKVWQPRGCFRIVTTKGSTVPRSTDWTITAVDLLNNLLDMELDTAHTLRLMWLP